MPTISIGRESCRGGIVPRVGNQDNCLGVQGRAMVVEPPAPGLGEGWPSTLRPDLRGGRWPRGWEVNPDWAQAKADGLGVEVSDLLCIGCKRRLARLIEEGAWTP